MKLLNVCKCVRYSATIKPFPELRKEDRGFESRGPTCPMILTDLLSHLAISPAGCGREARGWGWGKHCFPSEKQKRQTEKQKTEKQKDTNRFRSGKRLLPFCPRASSLLLMEWQNQNYWNLVNDIISGFRNSKCWFNGLRWFANLSFVYQNDGSYHNSFWQSIRYLSCCSVILTSYFFVTW
jgi:hypothetical protein